MKKRTKRFLIPFSVGGALAAVYWFLLLTGIVDRILVASPRLGRALEISIYPSEWLLAFIQWANLPPYGDAGFMWFVLLPGLQWIIIGAIAGFIWASFSKEQ